ncbi:MAG: TRAP transporter large permease subunit [Rhodospirillaceae bacterium]|nr:TRAP transporter large permease subunit [Rhodospirillaceae bacterium]
MSFSRLIQWMNGAGVVWVFALTFLICADITGRTLFDRPLQAVPEIVALSLIACVFLQLAFAVDGARLTRADIFLSQIRRRNASMAGGLERFFAIAGALVLLAMTAGAWPDFLRAFRTSEFVGVEGIYTLPITPIKFIVVLGAVTAALSYLLSLVGRCEGQSRTANAWLAAGLAVAVAAAIVAFAWNLELSDRAIGALAIIAVLTFIALGMPIAIALLSVGFAGLGLLKRDFGIATDTLSLAAQGTISEYVFATVPLFVLMGLFVSVSQIGRDSFRAAQQVFGRIRGGLGVATVAANSVFAAITGISIASAAIFSKIAVPEMVERGYTAKFAVGLTAGSSVLGMLIPPSLLLIIYGVIAEVSIGGLFLAAIVPGVILAAAFAIAVLAMARFWPGFVGRIQPGEASGLGAGRWDSLLAVFPVAALILLVLGGIYGGIFTPTEAGAAGAFAALCIALLRRRLTWAGLWDVMRETGQVTVTILFLIISASTFSRMLALTGLPGDMAAYLAGLGLGLAGFLSGYLLLLIVLGTVLDSTSILLILLPLALPVVTELGGNLIWFGVVTVIGVEIGLMTPPLGLSVYVIKSSLNDPDISLGAIFAGSFPFVVITFAVTLLLMAFPGLSLLFL